MNKKLLHKTSRAYLLFSLLILVVSAPIFYYGIQGLYIQEADDTLLLHKKEFILYSAPTIQLQDIPAWNRFNRNTKIENGTLVTKDSLFYGRHYDTLDAEVEPYRELYVPVNIQGKPFTYKARINLVETKDLLKHIGQLFLAITCLLLVGLYIITNRLSRKLWKPFYETLEQMESFEIDKHQPPNFSPTSIEEFNRLNRSIQQLIDKNILIYKSQREFIDNAAHELQTPLAVFQAKVDLLIQRPDLSEEQFEICSSLNENILRLTRLNRNLLLLSRLDNDSYADKENISLNDHLQKSLPFFVEQGRKKNIIIETSLEENLLVLANPALTEILVSNLLLNAIRHNVEDGTINISIKKNCLIISNTGLNYPLDKNSLFNRFYKADPSSQGTGLGLSIVKKIADLNNWTISYSFSNNNLHSFTINF